VRISGGINDNKIGGGTLHFNGILDYLSTFKNYEIMVIKNSQDSSNIPEKVMQLSVLNKTNRDRGDIQSFFYMIFGYFLARKNIYDIDLQFADKRNVMVIAESSALSDILCAAYFCRKYGYKGIIYFHHIPPPLWVRTFRRGFFKSIIKSLLTNISLILVKIFDLRAAIDVKRIMQYTSFKFNKEILEDEEFIPRTFVNIPSELDTRDQNKIYDGCYVGRIEEAKGIKDLIQCWKIVTTDIPDAKLVIVGNLDTRFGIKIKALTKKMKLEKNVLFMGYVSEEEKIKIMQSSKLFIFPSYEEGWSIAIMESIMAGLVPIMYDLPAYDYLGSYPYKVRIGKYFEFGKTITKLLRLQRNELKSVNIGLREKIKKYTLEYCTSKQMANFERVLNE